MNAGDQLLELFCQMILMFAVGILLTAIAVLFF